VLIHLQIKIIKAVPIIKKNNHAFEKTASDNEKTDDENISQTNTISVNNMSNTMPEHQNTLLTAENIFILFAIFILGFGIVILADKFRNR